MQTGSNFSSDYQSSHTKLRSCVLQIWKLIAAVPPADRPRILADLAPGAIRSLWSQSVARYVLSDERAAEIFADYALTDDFPTKPGQVRRRDVPPCDLRA